MKSKNQSTKLSSTSLYVGGSAVHQVIRPLTNALCVINQLQLIECDQTQDVAEEYTLDTPHYHQCGFITQSVQTNDELKYAVAGGEIDEEGKGTIRYLNYNTIFIHAVKAIQELANIVQKQ